MNPLRNPRWVDAILDWNGTWLLARLALTCAYWIGGLTKLLDFPGAIAEQQHFGLAPPALFAAATIAIELIGSALVVAGRWVWLGAGALRNRDPLGDPRTALRQWIADVQQVKPGARMPSYRHLRADEVDALVEYLAGPPPGGAGTERPLVALTP